MTETRFHMMPDGCRIAFRKTGGAGPVLVFLPGYMSDMAGSKASALYDWAAASQRACLVLDYSGCGESEGDFADGTLMRWREEVLALIAAETDERVILAGSSMGGWLMLLCGLALGERLAGLVGLAAAPDFTRWGFDEGQKAQLAAGKTIFEVNPYGPKPTPTHPGFWADGQRNLLLGGDIALDCPVRLLHGQRDAEVSWDIALQLAAALHSDDVQLTLVKDGDHRLSRDSDIELMLRIVAALSKY